MAPGYSTGATIGRENHFVPQLYLRAFSQDQRSMNCFNFARQLWITTASIKHHCSRRNFHSFSPGLEGRLKLLEDKSAEVLHLVRRERALPPKGAIARDWLLAYLAFQKTRTPSAIRQVTVYREYFRELLGEEAMPDPKDDVHPLALTLSIAKDIIPLAKDLEMHLLLNETDVEFITSDDPVVVHNQYCEEVKYRGVLGWSCTGLQVFLPISPTELLLLFDRDIYANADPNDGKRVLRRFRWPTLSGRSPLSKAAIGSNCRLGAVRL